MPWPIGWRAVDAVTIEMYLHSEHHGVSCIAYSMEIIKPGFNREMAKKTQKHHLRFCMASVKTVKICCASAWISTLSQDTLSG
jgi:hypothetical protein